MSIHEQQRDHLTKVVHWAAQIRGHLKPPLDAHQGRIHFRPSSGGVTMVDLSPKRPQLQLRTGFRDMRRFLDGFNASELLDSSRRGPDRGTPEKSLQSWIVSEAYRHEGILASLNAASAKTSDPLRLRFVTDEIAILPASATKKKILCDILALREHGNVSVPVVIELKTERQLKRLVEQVTDYAALVDEQADLFAELYSATLGRDVSFTGACEKWIVWPLAGENVDPREDDLATTGIRVVGYEQLGEGFRFRVGTQPQGTAT